MPFATSSFIVVFLAFVQNNAFSEDFDFDALIHLWVVLLYLDGRHWFHQIEGA